VLRAVCMHWLSQRARLLLRSASLPTKVKASSLPNMSTTRRFAALAWALLLPLVVQCVRVTLSGGEYATASLQFVQTGCFSVSISPASDVSGMLSANINTYSQSFSGFNMIAQADLNASQLKFTMPAVLPVSTSAQILSTPAFQVPPARVFSRWTTGDSCQLSARNMSCYGVFNDVFVDGSPSALPKPAYPGQVWLLTLLFSPASASLALVVDVDVSGCGGDGYYAQTDGYFPWQKNTLPPGKVSPGGPEVDACYNAYFAQLGDADVPVSPNTATCSACGKLGMCPTRASLWHGYFYNGFDVPDSLTVRAYGARGAACKHVWRLKSSLNPSSN
jgi:hypothetical protein